MAGTRGPAHRKLVGRFLRRNRRRGSGLAYAGAIAWQSLRIVLPLGVVVAAGLALREPVRRHPYFAVREVVLRHHGRLKAATLRRMAGIEPGMSIWDVDLARAKAGLEAEPWVRSAEVRRELPHRVVIRVREHRPVAIVTVADPARALYYVAPNGHIFASVGASDSHDFPYLTGLGAAELNGREATGPRAVRHALALLRLMQREHARLGAISEIHIDRARGLTLLPVRPPLPIELGWGRYERKLDHLAAVLRLWTGREAQMTSVTCVFEDQIVVRTRVPQPTVGARRATGA